MDWDQRAEEMFINCVEGIKKTNSIENPLEWKFFWEMLFNYKEYRDSKDRDAKKKGGTSVK